MNNEDDATKYESAPLLTLLPIVISSSSPANSSIPTTKAQARWDLLRSALKGTTPSLHSQRASMIHGFPGLQLIPRLWLRDVEELYDIEQQLIKRLSEDIVREDTFVESLEALILALQCACTSMEHSVEFSVFQEDDEISKSRLTLLRERLARWGILCKPLVKTDDDTNQGLFLLQFPPPSPDSEYGLYRYEISDQCSVVTRERKHSVKRRIKLSSLASTKEGVDQTGNARVWDSELTLTHLLSKGKESVPSPWCNALNVNSVFQLKQEGNDIPLRVLELGSGMAGVAGLALAQMAFYEQEPIEVVLSDGHETAVAHNQVQAALWDATTMTTSTTRVTAETLLWTDDIPQENGNDDSSLFDLILASDCVHFEDFHACLLLTVARQLRVGGVALLLQPPRGPSLQNFLTLLETCPTLFQVHYWKENFDDVVQNKHTSLVEQHHPTFDPNIHQAHLVVLVKLRQPTNEDGMAAQTHLQERKTKTPNQEE